MFSKIEKFIFVLLSSLALAATLSAYTPQYADEAQTTTLRWRNKTISVALSNSIIKPNANIKSDGDVYEAVRKSFEAWENVADIKFDLKSSDKQNISPAGKSGDGISLITIAQTPENLLLFNGDSSDVAAYTRVFFNRRGNIAEADIVLNPYAQFSTDGTLGTFDLQATLTHEIGHLLGLDHSSVSGSTMFENQGKNGTYSLSNFSYQTLSDDDITGIRGLYGAEAGNEKCCGILQGKISVARELKAKAVEIWLEEKASGKTTAAIQTGALGKFKINGLMPGTYRVYAQDRSNSSISAENLGEVEISNGKSTIFNQQFTPSGKKFDLLFSGFNGQISDTMVFVNKGNSYIIYFAGKNLPNDNFEVGFNSSYLTVNQKTLTGHDYGEEFDVFSVEVKIDAEAQDGIYSLYLRNQNGKSDFIIGGISVENTPNHSTFQTF